MIEIGQNLRYFRQKKRLTQKEVAELLYVTPQTVSKWELNKSSPDYDQLILLSKIYKKSINTLLGQSKSTVLDYLANSQNFLNQYGISASNNGRNRYEKNGRDQ